MKYLSILVFLLALISCRSQPTSSTRKHSTVQDTQQGEDEFQAFLEGKTVKYLGKPIGNIKVTTTDGVSYELDKMKGKIILLSFWFKQCKPCMVEIPSLNELHAKYKEKGVVVLAASTDNEATVRAIMADKKIKYPTVANARAIADQLEVTVYPTNILIDQQGIIRKIYTGGSAFDATQTYLEIKPDIEVLLKK